MGDGVSDGGDGVVSGVVSHTAAVAALTVRHLWCAYGDGEPWVIRDCSWTVPAGSLTVLAGASGSGKSTLLSCIAGLAAHEPTMRWRGDVLVDGVSHTGRSVCEIAQTVGFVQQNPEAQILNAAVEDEIAFGCENLAVPPLEIGRRVRTYSAMFHLDPTAATARLSGGQQERVCCAAALAMDRPMLLLDEPLASLDREGAATVMGALRRLADAGRTIIVCEHRIREVEPYADRTVELIDGGIRPCTLHPCTLRPGTLMPYAQRPGSHAGAVSDDCPRPEEHHSENIRTGARVPLLRMDGVRVRRHGRTTLDIDRLELHDGDALMLLGENGAGKSTLLSVMAGVLHPSAGRCLDGRVRIIRRASARAEGFRLWRLGASSSGLRTAYLWQNPDYQLFTTSVIAEMLARNADREACMAVLEEMGLAGLASRYPLALSEGQKRRLALATCLVSCPQLLLLDEPAAGQDEDRVSDDMEAVRRYLDTHECACVMATHDPRGAERIANGTLVMRQGRVSRR